MLRLRLLLPLPLPAGMRYVLVVPDTSLTKICIVSSSEACELMLETLLDRCTMFAFESLLCG